MPQNVYYKYGDTSIINGETPQQGKLLIDYEAKKVSIDKDGTNRVLLAQPADSALSTTSTNAIANNAITNSIINTMADVMAVTADYIPCGTKALKELADITVGTLTAGQTSITLTDARITTTSFLDFYTTILADGTNPNPLTKTVTTGQVVCTFPLQAVDIIVGVKIGGY